MEKDVFGLRGNEYKLSHACQAMLAKTISEFRIFHVPSISICVVSKGGGLRATRLAFVAMDAY